jgi:DNA polymerase
VSRDRGALLDLPSDPDGPRVLATLHPSAILRADDRDSAYAGFLTDLKAAAGALRGAP